MKATALIASMLLSVAITGGCSDGSGDAAGFCRRLDSLIVDLENGDVEEAEFRDRIKAENLGDPGGTLGSLHDMLEQAVEEGEMEQAVDLAFSLSDACVGVE